MSASQIALTVAEFIAVGLIIIGLYNEPFIAKWEQKQKEKIFKAFRKH